MTIERDKFPIVLTIIENFGLSSSWTGNAIASANPSNFYSLWDRNPHTVLYPDKINHECVFENEEIDLARLFAGREFLSDKKYLDQILEQNKLKENEILLNLLKDINDHNSALHLIGNLPGKTDKYANLNHLLRLLEIIKENKVFRVYLHLIVDDNLLNDQEFIDNAIAKIYEIKACEIASVIGKKYLDDDNNDARKFGRSLNALIYGQGEKALSPGQALSIHGIPQIGNKKPTSVLFKNRFVCKLNNFDGIFFFNHNNKSFTKLLIALASGTGSSFRLNRPKMLTISSFFNPLDQEMDQLKILYKKESSENLAQNLYLAGIDQLFLSDSSRISTVNRFLKGKIVGQGGSIKELFAPVLQNSNPAFYDQVLNLLLEQLNHHLNNHKAQFITLLIPALSSLSIKSFAQVSAIIKLVDNFLPKLEEVVVRHNGALVLTSDHAGTEKLSERNEYELLNNKTNNPVPFILTVPGLRGREKDKLRVTGNRMFYDMIKKSHFISDFAPTVLELAGVNVPETMTGKSFLPELKKIEITSSPLEGVVG